MGHKITPNLFRLGITKTWNSRWFADVTQYKNFIYEDVLVRSFLKKRLDKHFVDRVEIMKKINPKIILLSQFKKGRKVHCDYICECGSKSTATWGFIQQHGKCPNCSGGVKYNIDKIKEIAFKYNPNIEIIDTTYINHETKLKCHCNICNIDFMGYLGTIKRGGGCPICALKAKSGKNGSNWKGGISTIKDYLRESIGPWKSETLKYYNYKSDISGSNNDIVIHHLKNFSYIVYQVIDVLGLPRFTEINQYSEDDLKNMRALCLKLHQELGLGVCMTRKEHSEFHKIYGRLNNTIDQYNEFKGLKQKELKNMI
jgi:hypothetical protein